MSETLMFPVRPYSLPLTREQFDAALRSGHGRALQHVREHGAEGWDDIIVHMLTHGHRHDVQIEDDRTVWLLEVMDATGRGDAISERVIDRASEAVNTDQPDWKQAWDALQRMHALAELAKRGDQRARAALYAMPERDARGELLAAGEIIELDGEAGLLAVASRLGADPEKKYVEWEGRHLMDGFDEGRTEGAGRAVLEAASPRSPTIAAFLAAIDEEEREREERYQSTELERRLEGSELTAQMVIQAIRREREDVDSEAIAEWAVLAPVDDIERLFEAFIEDADGPPIGVMRCRRILRQRGVPGFKRLPAFLDHPSKRVRGFAHSELGLHRHPTVRELALKRIRAGRCDADIISLFRANFEDGDAPVLVEAMTALAQDEEAFHWALRGLLDLYKANVSVAAAELAVFVYEHSTCARCRVGAVRQLLDNDHAPEWMLAEAGEDGDDSVRKLARGEVDED